MTGNVYLVGMPGSGKSRAGRAAAALLDRPFVDLDREIERDAGRSVAELFEYGGEVGFRQMEKAALAEIARRDGLVVACGGGCVMDPDNRALLKATGTVVWLEVGLERLKARAPVGGKRPLLQADGDMERLLAEREPIYRDLADVVVEGVEDRKQMARAIVEALP